MEDQRNIPQLVYLSLGSNTGDAARQLARAAFMLDGDDHTRIVSASSVYRSEPVGGIATNDFYNCVLAVRTTLSPNALLRRISVIERQLGRIRIQRWGNRSIDIDIVLFGRVRLENEYLKIPHPEFRRRNFVLIPLLELSPDMRDIDGTPLTRYTDTAEGIVARTGELTGIPTRPHCSRIRRSR
ncbi:MAG: 2-amino-4-hydroxy-6-hydroxymethyldihydropteridine diphosphokinase [Spirochaetes bacterium]|nr:2-amino-4-hydroxy-6-hydroxymethyldihydropteridine diphosphokinase [Spirochaetota bacterium]